MCACFLSADDVDPQSPDGSVSPATEKRSNFRQILLGACQHEFEKFKLAVTEGTAEERTVYGLFIWMQLAMSCLACFT